VIKIQIRCIDQNIKQVRVSGHAGGRAGEDVVCAAVSAVTQTALTGLLHYGAEQVNTSASGRSRENTRTRSISD